MKRLLFSAAILAIAAIGGCVFIGAPNPKWGAIKAGMNAQEIVANLGGPKNDLLQSKSVQIWMNDGVVRTSSLAVLYYDAQNPELATKTMRSDIWLWERL